jgi:hypothetical protein
MAIPSVIPSIHLNELAVTSVFLEDFIIHPNHARAALAGPWAI